MKTASYDHPKWRNRADWTPQTFAGRKFYPSPFDDMRTNDHPPATKYQTRLSSNCTGQAAINQAAVGNESLWGNSKVKLTRVIGWRS